MNPFSVLEKLNYVKLYIECAFFNPFRIKYCTKFHCNPFGDYGYRQKGEEGRKASFTL